MPLFTFFGVGAGFVAGIGSSDSTDQDQGVMLPQHQSAGVASEAAFETVSILESLAEDMEIQLTCS